EIREAVNLLKRRGASSELTSRLASKSIKKAERPKHKQRRKALEEQHSRAVLELVDKDPEKYAVLSEFDTLLRRGSILPETVELKTIGKSLSKTFPNKSSRRDVISSLMRILSNRSLPEIKEVVTNILDAHRSETDDNDYYNLAQFIIKGELPTRPRE